MLKLQKRNVVEIEVEEDVEVVVEEAIEVLAVSAKKDDLNHLAKVEAQKA